MIELLKKNIFIAAPGLVVMVLLAAGYLKGFNVAHVVGIAAMFALHHKAEIAAIFQREAPQLAPQVQGMLAEFEKFKAQHKQEVDALQTELSKTNIAMAMKTGLGIQGAKPSQG